MSRLQHGSSERELHAVALILRAHRQIDETRPRSASAPPAEPSEQDSGKHHTRISIPRWSEGAWTRHANTFTIVVNDARRRHRRVTASLERLLGGQVMKRARATGMRPGLPLLLVGSLLSACGSSDAVPRCCNLSKADAVAICQSLQEEFFATLPTAQSCAVNGVAQCQKMVPLLSIGCSSPICLVAVNDDSALTPIASQWNQLGCGQLPGYVCAQGCRGATAGLCSAADGGARCDPTP
jgi:hypothetical protein